MSLMQIHIAIIVVAVALIGGLLADELLDRHDDKKWRVYYSQHPQQARPSSRSSYNQQPMMTPVYPHGFFTFHRLPIKDNRIKTIILIVCSWVLPVIIVDYTPSVVYSLGGSLVMCGWGKLIMIFVCVIAIICNGFYAIHRGYKINAILLWCWALFFVAYGCYIGYNIYGLYNSLNNLKRFAHSF